LLKEIRATTEKGDKILVTTLTKRSAEDLTEYYESLGLRVKYLHSDITTIERTEIIRDLRLGVFDVLVGINLLREGLDIPEVSLVGITDADKEGFLRSERSLIQTIGRAARNAEGRVILYADNITDSMSRAITETKRRRAIQEEYNKVHGITPATIKKRVRESVYAIYDKSVLAAPLPGMTKADLKLLASPKAEYLKDPKLIDKEIAKLRKQMKKASDQLEFEDAARVRDDIKRLELVQLSLLEGDVDQSLTKVSDGESAG
jgi:excinuclease ABC subunit B